MVGYRQLRAATADNAHGQQQHTVAKQDTQHTTAGKTTPGTPRTAHTQGTGADNKPWRATAAHRVGTARQHHARQSTRNSNQTRRNLQQHTRYNHPWSQHRTPKKGPSGAPTRAHPHPTEHPRSTTL